MCVIFSTFGTDPSEELLREGARRNEDGAGIAWHDNDGAVVRWKKGIKDVNEIIEMVKKGLPHPYLIHFRKRSIGEKEMALTQPFPLESDVPLDLEGSTERGVLAHNGTWIQWDREARPAIFGLPRRVPGGLWNDSRMLAYITANWGQNALMFLDWGHTGRIGILYPHATRLVHFNPSEWVKKEGFWMSADLEKTIITAVDVDSRFESWTAGYGRGDHFRRGTSGRYDALSTSARAPKPCTKCGTEGEINYNQMGRQWCPKCSEFFWEIASLTTGGGSGDSEKKAKAPKEAAAKATSSQVISRMHLHRIAGYMVTKQWWILEKRRAH